MFKRTLLALCFLMSFAALPYDSHINGAIIGNEFITGLPSELLFDVQTTIRLSRPCPLMLDLQADGTAPIQGGCYSSADKNTLATSDGTSFRFVSNTDYYETNITALEASHTCDVANENRVAFLTASGRTYVCSQLVAGDFRWVDILENDLQKKIYQSSGSFDVLVDRGGIVVDEVAQALDQVPDFSYQFNSEKVERVFAGGDGFPIPVLGSGTNRIIYFGLNDANPIAISGSLTFPISDSFVLMGSLLLDVNDRYIPDSLKIVTQLAETSTWNRSQQLLGFELSDLVIEFIDGTLTVKNSLFYITQEGVNSSVDPSNPHIATLPENDPTPWQFVHPGSDTAVGWPGTLTATLDTNNWYNPATPGLEPTDNTKGYCAGWGVDNLGNFTFFYPQEEYASYLDALADVVSCTNRIVNPFPWISMFAALVYEGQLADLGLNDKRAVYYFEGAAGGVVTSAPPPPNSVDWTMFTPDTRRDLKNTEALSEAQRIIVTDIIDAGDAVPTINGIYMFVTANRVADSLGVQNAAGEIWRLAGAEWIFTKTPYQGQILNKASNVESDQWVYSGTDWEQLSTKIELGGLLVSGDIGTAARSSSSIMDIQSTTQGVLFPRMTFAQRDAITAPANGLMVHAIDNESLFIRRNDRWYPTSQAENYTAGFNYYEGDFIADSNTWTWRAASSFTAGDIFDDWRSGRVIPSSPLPLSSCALNGGLISWNVAGASIDVSSGRGVIQPQITTSLFPNFVPVSWTAQTALALPSVTDVVSVYATAAGAIETAIGVQSLDWQKENILLGYVDGRTQEILPTVVECYDSGHELKTLNRFIVTYLKGLEFSGKTDLSLAVSDFSIYGGGIDPHAPSPSERVVAADDTMDFSYINQTGGRGADVTLVDPTTWDNGGTTTTVTSGYWTFQRVYLSLDGDSFIIQRSPTETRTYKEILDYEATHRKENRYIENPALKPSYIWAATLFVKEDATRTDVETDFVIKNCGTSRTMRGCSYEEEQQMLISGGQTTYRFLYDWDTGTADADPGAGRIRANNTTVTSATFYYVDTDDQVGNDRTTDWESLKDGDTVEIVRATNNNQWISAVVTADPELATGYLKIPIYVSGASGTIANNSDVNITAVSSSPEIVPETGNSWECSSVVADKADDTGVTALDVFGGWFYLKYNRARWEAPADATAVAYRYSISKTGRRLEQESGVVDTAGWQYLGNSVLVNDGDTYNISIVRVSTLDSPVVYISAIRGADNLHFCVQERAQ